MSQTSTVYQAYQANTYLFGGNAPYVEEMYENYLANPGSVPDTWREYFDALQHVPAVDGSNSRDVAHQPVIDAFASAPRQAVPRSLSPVLTPKWVASGLPRSN
jgi:2-oxoglutarate dehydrogenase E1 component